MIELLSPVGDFECLKAAVQNGADAVYFGAKSFGARAFASNFDDITLEQAINYAKLRNVKTYFTLNTLIKQDEWDDAISLAKKAYQYGIDSIIVQDFGLGIELMQRFPDLPIHASTQMTVHNLEGVQFLKKLGFQRVVLSRELNLEEIRFILENVEMEIEVFVHGALCLSYSGQCLFSSMIGGRSGNRGTCAQPCRLSYDLLEQDHNHITTLQKGYLLSTRDLCGLDYLPTLIQSGVSSLKIEGRMKSPEYVATVTRIYRKYIDLARDTNQKFVIDETDKTALMQVFNRGGFSTGHLNSKGNSNLVFPEKQNNMGIYLGAITNYNQKKGLVTTTLQNKLSIGDSLSFEKENTKYRVSELLHKNQNIRTALPEQKVTFGRMKGNIHLGDKIYKISDKSLSDFAKASFQKENKKTNLTCKIKLKKEEKIEVIIESQSFQVSTHFIYDYLPQSAKTNGITKEMIISQFRKTLDTEFTFSNFEIELEDNLFVPVSILNDIRRFGISQIREKIVNSFKRISNDDQDCSTTSSVLPQREKPKISLLLNHLNLNLDYTSLKNVDKLYIPLSYFGKAEYLELLTYFSCHFSVYIYLPTIIRKNRISITKKILETSIQNLSIKGIVISHLSQCELIKPFSNLDIVGNYTLNIYNTHSIQHLENLKIKTSTISPELDEKAITSICENTIALKELIVYGNLPVMTMNYCLLGKSNQCVKQCDHKCLSQKKYFLKDRMGISFRVIPDSFQTISTIYNSRTTSIEFSNFRIQFARIDILDETIEEINTIIQMVQNGNRLEGKKYTNGNLKRII